MIQYSDRGKVRIILCGWIRRCLSELNHRINHAIHFQFDDLAECEVLA